MKPTGARNRVFKQRGTALLRSTSAIVLFATVLFSIGASSFLYAIHVKSETDEKNRPAQKEKVGKLGEVDRGPRGKNEIALTFDAGAEAECFDDLISRPRRTHMRAAHSSSRENLCMTMQTARPKSQSMVTKLEITRGVISI